MRKECGGHRVRELAGQIHEVVGRCVDPRPRVCQATAVQIEDAIAADGELVARLPVGVGSDVAMGELAVFVLLVEGRPRGQRPLVVEQARPRQPVARAVRILQRVGISKQRILCATELLIADLLVPARKHRETAVGFGSQADVQTAAHGQAVEARVTSGTTGEGLAP